MCVHVRLTQVTFASDDRVTVRTVELGHILSVLLQDVHLHGSALGEAGVADVALVGLFPCKHERAHLQQESRRSRRPALLCHRVLPECVLMCLFSLYVSLLA